MPLFSTPDWEKNGTDEPDTRYEDGTASDSPMKTGYVLPWVNAPRMAGTAGPGPGSVDPQPFNPNYQKQTGVTDWINVESLGAKGDGVQDDTGFFQAANLIAQQPPGRMIYIPAGTYKLTQNITFSAGVNWLNMGTVSGGTLSGGNQIQFGGSSGMTNPMTTAGDLILGGVAGSPTRVGVGSNNQVLTVVGGVPTWAPLNALTNPMTTTGDIIYGGSAGSPQRLPVGSTGQVLTANAGSIAWEANPAGFSNPMTTSGDLILGGSGGSAGRLAIGGSNGQSLQVVNGAVAWAAQNGTPLAGPSSSQPVLFQQADGTIVVLPLSTYSISGDDSVWINNAFTYFPQITGGGSSYGGTYNGPWSVGTIRLLPADYNINTGVVFPVNSGATVNLIGHGPGTRLLVASGQIGVTSHVGMFGPQAGFPALQTMNLIQGLWIDGTNAGANGVGMELGGGWGRRLRDVTIANFTGANAIGLHLNNAPNPAAGEWMEKCDFAVHLKQNTTCVLIENTQTSNSGNSFEYNDFTFYINARNTASRTQPGVILRGGAFLSGGSLRIRGNFPGNSGPVLWIDGSDGNGNWSAIYHEFIDITVESNGNSNQPQTILVTNTTHNNISNCNGLMTFQYATWVQSNMTAGQLAFGGVIDGDNHLTSINQRPSGWL